MNEFNFYQNKKILVCGGGGFIGSHLSNALIDSQGIVTIVGKSLENKNAGLKNVKYISANLFDLNECKKVGELITKVIVGLSKNTQDNSKIENDVRKE